jgi:hypothetical protein
LCRLHRIEYQIGLPQVNTQRSAGDLAKFYTYLGAKGLMNERTAYARAQAALQVLSILDANEKEDLSTVDREAVFRRFVNKNGQRFTPGSLQTYKQRFNSAVDEFLSYAKDPAGYKPPTSGTRERTRTNASESAPTTSPKASRSGSQPASMPTGLLAYPLPLPSGAVAQLLLPPALTHSDADRITALVTAMVNALAVKENTAV